MKQRKGFVYDIIDGNRCYIKDYKSKAIKEELVIPADIDGVPVTKVCLDTFVDSGNYVTISDYIKAKHAIKKVQLPDTVVDIEPPSYYYECNVEYINVPCELERDQVQYLNLPCINGFYVTNDNRNYQTKDGVLFSKDKKELICYPNGNARERYDIPEGTEVICTNAFKMSNVKAQHLQQVIIPDSVKSIEDYAIWFSDAEVIIPDNQIEHLGRNVLSKLQNCSADSLLFKRMHTYKGGAFSIDIDMMKVSFPDDCDIEYKPDIDYREYLYFNLKRILHNQTKTDDVSYSFDFNKYWWTSKHTNHFFNTVIEINSQNIIGIKEKLLQLDLDNLSLEENVIIYRFICNPQKTNYGQRTYKKYLDTFVQINDIINDSILNGDLL